MSALYAKDRFLESLARCRESDGFLADFYARLIDADPEIAARFRFTKMERQRIMLSQALETCASAAEGRPEGLAALRELCTSHDRDHHNIKPEWYPTWRQTMIATAADHDTEWTAAEQQAWETILTLITNRIAAGYEGKPVSLAR